MKNSLIEIIAKVKCKAKEDFVPIVRDNTLEKLIQICRECNVKQVLEIGTATGYSGLNFLTIDNISLTTIEKDINRFEEAKLNFENAGVSEMVTQILGDAGEELKKLVNSDSQFDFIFLDGPKGQYLHYLPYLNQLLVRGGILFADNILLGGLINDESRVNHKNRTMVRNMKKFLDKIMYSDEFQTEIHEIDDGFAVCKKQ